MLLDPKNKDMKPDEKFLSLLSAVVGPRWPSLAVSLSLKSEIPGLKKRAGLSQEQCALEMLKLWASNEKAAYGQLCNILKTLSLFQAS